MNYPSIRVEGAILSPDIFGQIEDLPGQKPSDFGLDSGGRVKDEIARCWADAQDYWRIFQRKLETVREGSNATTETRNLWMVPLMGLLRYDIEYQARGTEIDGRIYAISHRATNRANTPVQIIGARDPAGLDKKPANAARRMSAHALVQEFLNLHDQLYGLVTDGRVLRLLRDSSRLVKQSYLEFDLDRIFTDGLFADFAVLYRMLHATRLPQTNDKAAESLIERYHQDSLDQGARIREGLSNAVEKAILNFGNGFLQHADNDALRASIANGELSASEYYQQLLRLIYRLLFLMVIEERDLVFPADAPKAQRDIHRKFYSVARLRRLSEQRYLADPRRHDLWLALQACFRLFEADGPGVKLGIAPLAGDLFSPEVLGSLAGCTLGNDVLLGCLRSLGLYRHPDSGQLIRVNYAALNVEEFGSVYEGLLEYQPEFAGEGSELRFGFRQGGERAATGSHYTPDDLVQPLLRHSLDHLVAACLRAEDPETALLGLRVADIACGSGHILLAAARRIATELAVVRTGEEQPSPSAYRAALRDAIRQCIYGVDLNPLAVELCKVALWLEAHIPGQPLNFLDHHIKCGNAIVGFARHEELGQGVPMEAFKTLPGDDKEVAASYRKRNKEDLKHQRQASFDFTPKLRGRLDAVLDEWRILSSLPESTPAQISEKKERFAAFAQGQHSGLLRTIADVPVAQFFVPKLPVNEMNLITDGEFRGYWRGGLAPTGPRAEAARTLALQHRFFHWFLEFPEVMDRGGFDCILGNPPYLGDKALSGTYGYAFCECIKWLYVPTGLSDLVVYFLRRICDLLRDGGFTAVIATNSIIDGDNRKDGLQQIVDAGAQINMAVRGTKWPGAANLVVSLLAVHKGEWSGPRMLDNRPVTQINTFFEEGKEHPAPRNISENASRVFTGYYWLGDGFLLSQSEANDLINTDPKNSDVVFPVINAKEINNEPDQRPQRHIIDFKDWPCERAKNYPGPFSIVEEKVKPYRLTKNRKRNRDYWWLYAENRPGLTAAKRNLTFCFVTANTTKHMSWSPFSTNIVISHPQNVFTTERWDLFAVVQSTLHEVWARKYSGSQKQDLRYSPSKCFNTFVFPEGLWQTANPSLAEIGKRYHAHRKDLMQSLWVGLTKTYNLFHALDLSPELVRTVSKKNADTATAGYEALLELRRLHIALDFAVRDAYSWQDLYLEHDFHEVETLPENDRVRYTVSPVARREVLKRLLAENHARTGVEAKGLTAKPKRESRPRMPATEVLDIFESQS
ncbi:MAG: restriction endonuclease [Rhodospirillaceae bacterium]|nr:restriction endonuclease [Rhodospirillaceae bacterium]MYI48507.1 restriction endonuclease [Rhodospirillaceae bacterium]